MISRPSAGGGVILLDAGLSSDYDLTMAHRDVGSIEESD
jgi:hypothetical protein